MSAQRSEINNLDFYKEYLPISEKRILHKLVQAVIRERAADSEWIPKDESSGMYVLSTFNGQSSVHVYIDKKYLLGHLEISHILHIKEGQKEEVTHPVQFLHSLFQETAEILNLAKEIKNSVRNDALALSAGLRKKVLSHHEDGIFQTLLEMKRRDPDFSPLALLEQSVIEGHTLHPCSKTRMGLSIEENMKYAPEWNTIVELMVLAIHKDSVKMSSVKEQTLTDLLLLDYPELMKETTFDRHSHELLPVHPWQFEHTIKKYLASDLAAGKIIVLDRVIKVMPMMSFRSMAPFKGRYQNHIKTAVNIQMTSAKRIVSPASVQNGPLLSKVLKNIEKQDSFINGKTFFLSEMAGSHYVSQAQNDEIDLEKNLSCIIRENPESYLGEEELAFPAASLINRISHYNETVLEKLIKTFSETHDLSIEVGTAQFIEQYAKVLLRGLLQLMIKYGISMEAHLQNAIIVFQDGLPVKLMVRDNGGIRIHRQRAAEWMDVSSINNSTNLLTSNSADLYQMFSHAVIHNHLGELIVKLVRETKTNERVLWHKVGETVLSLIKEISEEEGLQERIAELEDHIFADHTYLKALIKMRLSDSYTENMYVKAANPIHPLKKGGSIQ
ncbi:IucA/IucC family protein [Bacillus sp. SCS-153A]|uniref:IucA/IucC family protein n=1 Tax=Rossellomorea sedimentorum TaxID=3115294 RepID=UPI0039063B26